jgi:hypothetical protein
VRQALTASSAPSLSAALDRLQHCASAAERAQVALRVLLEATCASAGHLFGLRDGRLSWLASSESAAPEPALIAQLERYLHDQLEVGAAATELASGSFDTNISRFSDARGRVFEAMLLESRRSGENVIGAVAALHGEHAPLSAPNRALLERLADALLENDDVDPVTCAL